MNKAINSFFGLIIVLLIIFGVVYCSNKIDIDFNSTANKNVTANYKASSNYSFPSSFNNISIIVTNVTHNLWSGIETFFTGSKIDDDWVNNFMSIVNTERAKKGLSQLQHADNLNSIADSRFSKMMENPFISHYGATEYNIGEVIFYPEGSTAQAYIDDMQVSAPIHWNLLMNPSLSRYGYHIGVGPVIEIVGSCPTTEIPGPNINVKDYFEQQGCQTTESDTTWLVIDMDSPSGTTVQIRGSDHPIRGSDIVVRGSDRVIRGSDHPIRG